MMVKVYGRVSNRVYLDKADLFLYPGWQNIDINKKQFEIIKREYLHLVTFVVPSKKVEEVSVSNGEGVSTSDEVIVEKLKSKVKREKSVK